VVDPWAVARESPQERMMKIGGFKVDPFGDEFGVATQSRPGQNE
jgi:hypothetical protein